jgi:hypothetical protein
MEKKIKKKILKIFNDLKKNKKHLPQPGTITTQFWDLDYVDDIKWLSLTGIRFPPPKTIHARWEALSI